MPPVRWKLFIAVILICLTRQVAQADALHDSVPMSSDGWRPIIGTSQRDVQDEITLYRNPTQIDDNSEPIKAQPIPVHTPSPTLASKPYQTITASQVTTSSVPVGSKNPQGGKVLQHPKLSPQFMLLPNHHNHGHGPHIPLTSPGLKGGPRRHPSKNKIPLNGKRHVKPVRGPVIAHSMKHEVYVPAPSAAIGSFTFYNQGPGPKPQGNKPFQPQFPSQFGLTGLSGLPSGNDVLIQQVPVQTFLIQHRNPIQNENLFVNHNDEYTRNLVPPPYKPYQQEKEKQKVFKQKEPSVVVTEQAASIRSPQFIIGKPKDHRTVVPENIIVQLPPPFEHQAQFVQNYNQQKIKDPEVEVQVTKEKLKVFHNSVPPNYNINEEQYQQQYSFQSINKPIEQQKVYAFESFPAIKNQKQTFRKPTEAYPIFEEPKREMFKKPVSEAPTFQAYDVTEGKQWQGFQPFISTRPSVAPQESFSPQPPPRIHQQEPEYIFLPTPYTPDSSVPTSPTQSEISSIYAELNQRNRPAPHEFSTFNPNFFNIKEVSTHYPIVGRPESPGLFAVPTAQQSSEVSNEITTAKEEQREPFQIYQPAEEPETTMPPTRPPIIREWQGQRQRPHQRRRRPTHRPRTTTTEEPSTETYEVHKVQSSMEDNYSGEMQRPHRRRRPTRPRTTEAPLETTKAEEVTRPTATIRQRHRTRYDLSRVRPTASAESIEEMPSNHKMTEAVSYSGGVVQTLPERLAGSEFVNRGKTQYTTQAIPVSYENEVAKTEQKISVVESEAETENYPKMDLGKNYHSTESDAEAQSTYQRTSEKPVETQTETSSEEVSTHSRRRMRYPSTTTTTTTTEQQPISNILTPENEVDYDYSTPINHFEPSKETITIQEVYSSKITESEKNEATLATTTAPTTTTTTEASTTKSYRIRQRPVKYDNKNRPRFSVKEYRQRLSQYSSTTAETPRSTTEASRGRFPNRSRRPVTIIQEEEPSTERTRFTPKEPRHSSTSYSANDATVAEKKVNTRLRPFGRHRSTTEAPSSTQKISIKPNIFSNLRRPPPISLRTRIMNKHNRTGLLEKTTEKPNEVETGSESSENVETTVVYSVSSDSTTESDVKKVEENQENETIKEEAANEETANEENANEENANEETVTEEPENEEMANKELMKNESFIQSQRVADLTVLAQKEYDTPGMFKSVSPNTRIVPNYFTISTDDPILPIEAFFPNLKDKTSKSDYK